MLSDLLLFSLFFFSSDSEGGGRQRHSSTTLGLVVHAAGQCCAGISSLFVDFFLLIFLTSLVRLHEDTETSGRLSADCATAGKLHNLPSDGWSLV